MTTEGDKFCSQCGFPNCPHEGNQLPEATVVIDVTIDSITDGYDPSLDNSLDHKSNALRGNGIQFAMMKYFGSAEDTKSLLCYNWLELRGPIEPLNDMGSYLAYRRNYNFDDLA